MVFLYIFEFLDFKEINSFTSSFVTVRGQVKTLINETHQLFVFVDKSAVEEGTFF